jgi:hypothetical protein
MTPSLDDIEFPSNSGWNSVFWRHVRRQDTPSGPVHVATIEGTGQFWDRAQMFADDSYDLVLDHTMTFHGVLLPVDQLAALHARLRAWLDDPAELFTMTLGADRQDLRESLDVSVDVICSEEKPVLTMAIVRERAEATCWFVVDQSCIRLAARQLASWLD